MKILFIGDIYGKPGRRAVRECLPEIEADLIIANAENVHHGKGVSDAKIKELQELGIDYFTSGNHVWKVSEIYEHMKKVDYPLIRPANYPENIPGRGDGIVKVGDKEVLVINLMGRVFMHANLDDPFRKFDQILDKYSDHQFAAIVVDFHAEASSEKWAFAHYVDGKASAVFGTHTHVPTADERILQKGTAFQTDVGMNGPINSVIGAQKEPIIENFLTQMPVKHEVAEGPVFFNATLIDVDEKTRHAKSIERIQKYID
ncbi:TIGR00282 family metallophosphoesterase [Candidatus Peregrinibacteria bacterium]|nr:TIGR00282 family metallophosphoesterase [Candidatus Peregrinibacteria bacterium]